MDERKNGEFVGAFASYGYIKSPNDNHKLIIDKESAKIVKKIFEWKVNEGLGNLAICHRLNDMGILNPTGYKKKKLNQNYNNSRIIQEDYSWCTSTIRNILRNDIYIGNMTQGKRRVKSYKLHKVEQVPEDEWVTVENMHEPIIEKELFEKAQNMRMVDTRVQNNGILSMWAGILKCADCKRAMHKKTCKNKSGKTYEYYICGTYRKKSNNLCTKHTIKVEELEKAVLEAIKLHMELFVDTENLLNKISKQKSKKIIDENIKNIKKDKENEIEKIKNLKRGLYEDWKNGYIKKEEFLEYRDKYEKDMDIAKKNIINLDKENKKEEKVTIENNKWIQNLAENKNITELDRDIIEELIDYIEVYENNKIAIHFKFSDQLSCSDKIHQGGGVAAPVGGQILGEVLPYLELQQDKETEETPKEEVEMPEIRNKTVKEAKQILKEIGLELEINNSTEEINEEEEYVKEQIPKPGIKITKETKVYIDI